MKFGDEVAMRGQESDTFYKERSLTLASQAGGKIVERDGQVFLDINGRYITLAAGSERAHRWYMAWAALSREVRARGLDRRKTPRL